MAEPRSRGLGRGLSALLGDTDTPAPVKPPPAVQVKVQAPAAASAAANTEGSVRYIPIELLRRNPQQPRRHFEDSEITELATSVKEKGVLQPILVRPAPGAPGEWQIVAGERRWRAAQRAGLQQVPVLIRELNDLEVLEVAIVENVQRAELSPLEEAAGYQQLIEEFGFTQAEVAESVGRERSTVANLLRLLQLPASVQRMVNEGALSMGHARALLGLESERAMADLAREAADGALTVRAVEERVRLQRDGAERPAASPRADAPADPHVRHLETELQRRLGTAVRIRVQGNSKSGRIEIPFYNADDFDRLLETLLGEESA